MLFAWVFFRAQTLEQSIAMLRGMLGGSVTGTKSLQSVLLLVVLLPVLIDTVIGRWGTERGWELNLPLPIYGFFLGVMAALLLWLQPMTTAPFIYFQF